MLEMPESSSGRPEDREQNQPKREAGSKAEGMDLFKPFDIRHEGMGFEVCPTVFQHCFAPVFFFFEKKGRPPFSFVE